jgi:hypothetical protein
MTTCCDIALSGDLKILRNAARAMAETTPSIKNPRIVCGHFALASQGLGLSASCFIITSHGGMDVDSAPVRGMCVHIELPCRHAGRKYCRVLNRNTANARVEI